MNRPGKITNRILAVSVVSAMLWITGCGVPQAAPSLGQGQMAGRVTEDSVILQSRLTKGDKLVDGDLPGNEGVACFEIATNRDFSDASRTDWQRARWEYDHIIKTKVSGLKSGTRYYYRLVYGSSRPDAVEGRTCTFRTLGGKDEVRKVSFAVVTGMNYFFFKEGAYNRGGGYKGDDKHLGYPSLASILKLKPDFFVGTGDTVYFDHPAASSKGDRYTGLAWSDRATTETEMRRKYHEQFIQPRFADLFAEAATYWEVDDHEYRYNDCDNTGDKEPSVAMGRRNFREQLPVVDPKDPDALTYGTFRVNRHLQIWLVEGREFRSPNKMADGPKKSIWGETQKQWLKDTLKASDATFKILISPTPMVGPDGDRKTDNHANTGGFRHEGDEFFDWLKANGFLRKNFYICCGDRHWQYHAVHPSGFEEFSCGSIVEENSRTGVRAGDPASTDPEGKIKQPYCVLEKEDVGPGFLVFSIVPDNSKKGAHAEFSFYDQHGKLNYSAVKRAK